MEKYPKKRAYVRGKLKKFLDEKGVTNLFIENCKTQFPDKRNIKELLIAFDWSITKQRHKFWSDLNNQFEELNDKT
jgi:hypothetical protein